MPILRQAPLVDFTASIFAAHGVPSEVAQVVADSLVLANLKGHDSHGVIRVIDYVDWIARGWFNPQGKLDILRDSGVVLMIDGNYQFGQVIGREATRLAIQKTREHSVCLLTIRRAGHLGRIGEFMEMAAEVGLVSFSFTNTHGGGVLVAPHGGCERRLSANPYGGGAPTGSTSPAIIMDMATSTIAEGKIKVARSKGTSLPPGCIVNGRGEPSTDPEEYYGDPPGCLLPMAGHKGFAFSVFAEIFAGALSGAGCSRADADRVANAWFAIFVDPDAFCGRDFFQREIERLTAWIKSSRLMHGFDQIMLPGEPEAAMHRTREADGIPIDATTWNKIVAIANQAAITPPEILE